MAVIVQIPDSDRVELSDPTARYLIKQLHSGGIRQNDVDTGEVVATSPMYELGDVLEAAASGPAAVVPTPAQQGILVDMVHTWASNQGGVNGIPGDAWALRCAIMYAPPEKE